MEKHGSRSWTQRATACLCLATHNFHILDCSAAPRSLSASEWAPRLWERHAGTTTQPQKPRSPPRHSERQLEEKKDEESTTWVGQLGWWWWWCTNVGFFFPLLPGNVSPPEKKCIVQMMRQNRCGSGGAGGGEGGKEGGGLQCELSPKNNDTKFLLFLFFGG